MNKELYVSSTPHETKVALVEDDQLAEVFFERDNEYTLAGSIYKGRVTRVLPGMQSAFVEIGLERDAFLYVSDFLELSDDEDAEEFGEIPAPRTTVNMNQQSPNVNAQAASCRTSSRRRGRIPGCRRGRCTRRNGRGKRRRRELSFSCGRPEIRGRRPPLARSSSPGRPPWWSRGSSRANGKPRVEASREEEPPVEAAGAGDGNAGRARAAIGFALRNARRIALQRAGEAVRVLISGRHRDTRRWCCRENRSPSTAICRQRPAAEVAVKEEEPETANETAEAVSVVPVEDFAAPAEADPVEEVEYAATEEVVEPPVEQHESATAQQVVFAHEEQAESTSVND